MTFDSGRRTSRSAIQVAIVIVLGVLALAGPSAAGGALPPLLETALYDPNASAGGPGGVGYANESLAYSRSYQAGARVVRIPVFWNRLVPNKTTRPAGWDTPGAARNPLDPNYNWTELDRQVTTAVDNQLKPLLALQRAPRWAEQEIYGNYREGVNDPRPSDFADFAAAVASRYSGTLLSLPRVSLFEAWNEPNNEYFLRPQFDAARNPVSPGLYRELVNAMAASVKSVHADNLVVAGGSSPFGRRGTVGPLVFMKKLLCLSPANKVECAATTSFDIWSHHPYTSGGPTHRSSKNRPGDVQIGDLSRMRQTLTAARRGGRIATDRSVRFWVTEFSWDTSPPDRKGVPSARHARWVSEALYRMWRSGVSLVTWTQLRDYPFPAYAYQAGFYRSDPGRDEFNKPKLSLTAFRFPFVAFRVRGGITVWGRTPTSQRVPVVIQRKTSRGWVRLARVSPNAHGIFSRRISTRKTKGEVRARWVARKQSSVPFVLRVRTADIFVSPLGCGEPIPCG